MKRLFKVNGILFDNKMAAKVVRDHANEGLGPEEQRTIIRRGPDHWKATPWVVWKGTGSLSPAQVEAATHQILEGVSEANHV